MALGHQSQGQSRPTVDSGTAQAWYDRASGRGRYGRSLSARRPAKSRKQRRSR